MKLRNKKTGKVYDLECITVFDRPGKNDIGDSIDEFYTIAGLTEEWEDYTPAEPLIKDEKIRKAVRAWAEAIEINDNKVAFNRYSNGFSCMENEGLFSNITFDGRAFDFVDGKLYTIAELCGEEEE